MLKAVVFFALALSVNALSPFDKHPGAIPRSIEVPKVDWSKVDPEEFGRILEEAASPPTTQRYPGYKKGTQDFSNECGISGGGKITGGEEATPHSYPWMAALFFDVGDDTYFCGGTVISNKWVMTAAHCVDGADNMTVFLGAHNVREASEEGRLEIVAKKWFPHPQWSQIRIKNDIGLIELPEPIEFNDIIRPICLPSYSDESDNFAGLDAPASGWGKPNDAATSISPVLRDVTTKTITNLLCIIELITINKDNICISGAGGKSTCNGDSGGPLHKILDDGRYKQIGITSFGLAFGCELGLHAAFTRTTSFLEFIETETGVMIDP